MLASGWRTSHGLAWCDEEFVPQRVTGRFCSDKCRWRWKYELGRLRKAA